MGLNLMIYHFEEVLIVSLQIAMDYGVTVDQVSDALKRLGITGQSNKNNHITNQIKAFQRLYAELFKG